MIVGVGIDVASIERVARALTRFGTRFWERVLSPRERAELAARGRGGAEVLAGRFAAKEAGFKALGGPPELGFHDVEVVVDARGAPRLELRGKAAEHAAELGVTRAHLSITHDAGVAAAVVVLEGRAPG